MNKKKFSDVNAQNEENVEGDVAEDMRNNGLIKLLSMNIENADKYRHKITTKKEMELINEYGRRMFDK